MSLILNNDLNLFNSLHDVDIQEKHPDVERLDRYLAIIETNKKSSQFVPNDAYLALDMAGFAMGKLNDRRDSAAISAARLALALVQPCRQIPVQ